MLCETNGQLNQGVGHLNSPWEPCPSLLPNQSTYPIRESELSLLGGLLHSLTLILILILILSVALTSTQTQTLTLALTRALACKPCKATMR